MIGIGNGVADVSSLRGLSAEPHYQRRTLRDMLIRPKLPHGALKTTLVVTPGVTDTQSFTWLGFEPALSLPSSAWRSKTYLFVNEHNLI